MKIVVLNGSPKGDVSVTRQYVLHLEKAFPSHQFVVLNVALHSKKLAERRRGARRGHRRDPRRGRRHLGVPAVHPAGLLAVQAVH